MRFSGQNNSGVSAPETQPFKQQRSDNGVLCSFRVARIGDRALERKCIRGATGLLVLACFEPGRARGATGALSYLPATCRLSRSTRAAGARFRSSGRSGCPWGTGRRTADSTPAAVPGPRVHSAACLRAPSGSGLRRAVQRGSLALPGFERHLGRSGFPASGPPGPGTGSSMGSISACCGELS